MDDVDRIFSSNYSLSEKFSLSRLLLGLAARFAIGRRLQSGGSAQVIGIRLEFANSESFLFLLEEIFIRLSYRFLSRNPRPIIIDCGSNIGVSVAYFKKSYPGSKILAFEPDPASFALLRRNVEQNALDGVDLKQMALCDRRGAIDFFRDSKDISSGINSTILQRVTNAERISVEAGLLSDYIAEEVDFLKLDVEGVEEIVLQDLASHGKLRLVREMVMEYHHHASRGEDKMSSALSLLEENGFGYQIDAKRALERDGYQDVLIHAYRK